MLKIKRFLGFTDGIKEPRKTKVENELSACYTYKGNYYSAVEFLCVKLLEGCYPDKEENYQYYKRNGELSKPKTLYKYCSEDTEHGKTYFELNKTQYNFVCYLIENGLNTEESILEYDKADIERVEALQRAEAEEKARQEEAERKAEEEKENFKRWMWEESEKIPQFQKDIVDAIFLNIYGQENKWNYSIVPCINNYNNPMCKAEIISRLHNDNKASIKIFECLTGLKLPKGYKERIAYLEGLTVADFKEVVDYKPRKKAEHTEKELREFYISERYSIPEGHAWRWIKVIAEPIEKYGIKMFVRESKGYYTLSLEECGGLVTSGKSKSECMDKLKNTVESMGGKDEFLKRIEDFNKMILECAGKNPLYEVA